MSKTTKRKICIFSGKRGGFGAYFPLMRLIESDPTLELQILLGDMHASPQFGKTVSEAKKLFPASQIELIKMGAGRGDSPKIRIENLGVCLEKSAEILERLGPDIVMVHGDRAEHLMIALSALNLGLAVTHTQGGDISGNIDDIQRHAIAKLAHLHFPEDQPAAERIRKMGEDSWRIHVVGSLYIDRIAKKMFTSEILARKKYGLREKEKFFIVLFHPSTYLSQEKNYQQMKSLLEAVGSFGLRSLVLFPCSDPGYGGIIQAIEEVRKDQRFLIFKNIENLDFLSLMSQAQAIIGNSSCALVEAPYFQLPAINLGQRQEGRLKEENVVDAESDKKDLIKKIKYVLTDVVFRRKLKNCGYHLGDGRASEKVLKVLRRIKINDKLLIKRLTY